MRNFMLYVIFKARLVSLNRKLGDRPFWKDLLLVRWGRLFGGATNWVTGLTLAILGAPILIPTLRGVGVDVIELVNNPFASAIWPRFESVAWAIPVSYLIVEIIALAGHTIPLTKLSYALEAASVSTAKAKTLEPVWKDGSRHQAFLDELFALYERDRAKISDRLQIPVEVVHDRGRAAGCGHAGSWQIGHRGVDANGQLTRPTAVNIQQSFREVPLETHGQFGTSGTLHEATLSEVKSGAQAEQYWERHLMPYATHQSADGRTKFLRQWRQARRQEQQKHKERVEDVSALELQAVVDAQEVGVNYVVAEIHSVPSREGIDRITIDLGRANYGQIMRSCDFLIEEALLAAGICATGSLSPLYPKPLNFKGPSILRTMPARAALSATSVDELLLKPKGRAVGIGLAGVIVSREETDLTWIYKRRSFDVGTYPGMFHAVPTGMFNAKCASEQRSNEMTVHLGRVLLTELLEECKDVRSLGQFGDDPNWLALLNAQLDWWTWDPDAFDRWAGKAGKDSRKALTFVREQLRALSNAGIPRRYSLRDIRIHTTGLAFDLLSLRPEVCCAIEIPSALLATMSIMLNEEGSEIHAVPSDGVEDISQVAVSAEWVRSGYAALTLAYDAFTSGKAAEGMPCVTAEDLVMPPSPRIRDSAI